MSSNSDLLVELGKGYSPGAVPKELYVHWAVVLVIVLLVISICCWGLGPNSWRKFLGYEGMQNGAAGEGATMVNVPQYVQDARALHAMSPTSASNLYQVQDQINFQNSSSGQATMSGVIPQGNEVVDPHKPVIIYDAAGNAGFLGGPQAPAFFSPPGSTNMTTHQYPQAISSATQAFQLGLGVDGARAVVDSETFHGGYEYQPVVQNTNILPRFVSHPTATTTAIRGFSEAQLNTKLGGG